MKRIILASAGHFIAVAALGSFVLPSVAQEAELYGKPLPADAALVRAIGFEDSVYEETLGRFLLPDHSFEVVLDEMLMAPNQIATLTPFGMIIHDSLVDMEKVQVALFNSGFPQSISLMTSDGKIQIASASTDSAGFRELNPLVVPVAIFAGDKLVGEPFELTLVRDDAPTVWVDADGEISVLNSEINWDE